MKIITNNKPRTLLSIDELTETEKAEFDYMDGDAAADCAQFFRHRGVVYTTQDFMRVEDKDGPLADWHGVYGESYWSGKVIRYIDDDVVVGSFYS